MLKVDLKPSTRRMSTFMLGRRRQDSWLTPTACQSRRTTELSAVFVEIVRIISKCVSRLMGHIETDDGCSYKL